MLQFIQVDHHQCESLAISEMSRLETESPTIRTEERLSMIRTHLAVGYQMVPLTSLGVYYPHTAGKGVASSPLIITTGIAVPEPPTAKHPIVGI